MVRQPPPPTTTSASILGWVLARIRESRGLPQVDVAAALGVTQSAWSRIERGENALSVDGLFAVAGVLGTTASEIIARADEHARRLRAAGVRVVNPKEPDSDAGAGVAFVVGAALTALIIAALTAGDGKRK